MQIFSTFKFLKKKLGYSVSLVITLASMIPASVIADETCLSPYMAKIVGQEDFVYVWTLGKEGLGDEQDKLVTIDVNPASATYGTIINTLCRLLGKL